ncbi:uncharacterized protein EV154DRAFT_552325 [Mucor mucedo]|uniref:uncharacterized protein n=1 Tax=Mucor mucedo TaxID=29922 RepID=UPI00221F9D65|nr:uncharacterized protein EV154DRAFT_552325 [Mucor mucedo]KAI7890283.1 hypothetical protein EV154DRAFT_552325 [Mucor mucedo]
MLNMLDGESTCKASKSIAKTQEKMYGSNIPLSNGFGRRIDLILATKNLELSTSEWKRVKTSPSKCLQQQSKNIRMNKAILTYLLRLPFNEADSDLVFTVGMEWTGSMGYMFAIKQVKDIYVAKSISTLLMPSYLEELLSFEETLNCLTSVSADIDSSPNIYLTPSRRRRSQTLATTDFDLEDLSNDEQ